MLYVKISVYKIKGVATADSDSSLIEFCKIFRRGYLLIINLPFGVPGLFSQ